jgi:hypothetical protein
MGGLTNARVHTHALDDVLEQLSNLLPLICTTIVSPYIYIHTAREIQCLSMSCSINASNLIAICILPVSVTVDHHTTKRVVSTPHRRLLKAVRKNTR